MTCDSAEQLTLAARIAHAGFPSVAGQADTAALLHAARRTWQAALTIADVDLALDLRRATELALALVANPARLVAGDDHGLLPVAFEIALDPGAVGARAWRDLVCGTVLLNRSGLIAAVEGVMGRGSRPIPPGGGPVQ